MPRITSRTTRAAALTAALLFAAPPLGATIHPVLVGSHQSMVRQNRIAHELDFTFARTRSQVLYLARRGAIVPVQEDDDLLMRGVSYAYTRPTVRLFLRHLSADYAAGCGRPLVVTSLTRPVDEQPWNASPLSVHPAGMAVDLRRPSSRRCRHWLETRLLELEAAGVLDVTREHNPPHYHVAVFPEAYKNYTLARRIAADSLLVRPALAGPDTASLSRQPIPSQASAGPTSTVAGPITGMLGALLILAADGLRRRRSAAWSTGYGPERSGMQEPPPSDESERRGS